jgi:hypothetical protein
MGTLPEWKASVLQGVATLPPWPTEIDDEPTSSAQPELLRHDYVGTNIECLWAGEGIDLITELSSATELMGALVAEAENAVVRIDERSD